MLKVTKTGSLYLQTIQLLENLDQVVVCHVFNLFGHERVAVGLLVEGMAQVGKNLLKRHGDAGVIAHGRI